MTTTTRTASSMKSRRREPLAALLLLLSAPAAALLLLVTATAARATALHRHDSGRHPITNATYTVGLSATGFLLPFMQGAMEMLAAEAGVVTPGVTPVAGSSGGAMLAMAACSGAPLEATHAALEALAERCRPWACTFTQDDAVREALDRIMDAGDAAVGAAGPKKQQQGDSSPGGAAVAERCRGKAFAAISVAFGRGGLLEELRRCASGAHPGRVGGGRAAAAPGGPSSSSSAQALLSALLPRPAACALSAVHTWWWHPALWVVGSDWRDRADLADGVAASCFFPTLSSATRPWASLRGRSRLIDGVFASPLPLPPLADGLNARPVRVSAVPLGTSAAPLSRPITEAEIAPFLRVDAEAAGANIPGLPTRKTWRRFLLVVPNVEQRAAMRELGRREAFAWWSEEVVAAAAREGEAAVAVS